MAHDLPNMPIFPLLKFSRVQYNNLVLHILYSVSLLFIVFSTKHKHMP